MSQFVETACRSDVAAGAIAKHLRVKTPGALVVAGASDASIGTMEYAALAAGPCTVRLTNAQGTRKMVAVDAITAGNNVYAAAGGKISAAGTVVEGKALETSAVDGDIIEVLPITNTDISTSITGTNAATFQADADLGKPRTAIGSQTGGTGDFKAVILPPTTLTADRNFTLVGDAADSLVGAAAAQTLTNKTMTSPIINTPTVKDLTETVAATNVIAASETGSVFFLSSATEFVSTLPAPAAGLKFSFIVAAAPSGASYTIVTNGSSNIILGHCLSSQDAGGTADSETSGGDTISFVDSKAVVGDRVDVISDGTSWFARCTSKVFDAITITTVS
jgi:hypothetical protein